MRNRLGFIAAIGTFVLFATFARPVSAGTKEVGNGGDSRCAEFYQLASRLSVELVKIGQARIDKVNPLIQAARMRAIVKTLKVLPARDLNRQAISDSATNTTWLDVRQYRYLTLVEKVRLVSHELMVLAGIESDGEYAVSEDLSNLVGTTRMLLREKCERFNLNSDGSYTIQLPYFLDESGPHAIKTGSDLTGICKSLGFARKVGSHVERRFNLHTSSVTLDAWGRLMRYVELKEMPLNFSNYRYQEIVYVISCAD